MILRRRSFSFSLIRTYLTSYGFDEDEEKRKTRGGKKKWNIRPQEIDPISNQVACNQRAHENLNEL